jgi:hypothetical protein
MNLKKDIEIDIITYLKDYGFENFEISNIRECVYKYLTKTYTVYDFNLRLAGNSHTYRIKTNKINDYYLRRTRKLKIEELFDIELEVLE